MKTLTLILALALTGCSVFEQKIGSYKDDHLSCKPDTEFLNSCDGFFLDKPITLEETEL